MTRRRAVSKEKSEDAGLQRRNTDLVLCEAAGLDNTVCVHESH